LTDDSRQAQLPDSDDTGGATDVALSEADVSRRERADELYAEARAIRQRDYVRLKVLAEASLALALERGADGEIYRAGAANALTMLALSSAAHGDCEAALSQAAQAIAYLDSTAPSTVLGDAYDAIGEARFVQGDFVKAIDVLGLALDVARQTGDRSLEAYAIDSMACISSITGHWQDALEGHLEALAIQEELGDELNAAIIRNNLSYTHVALGRLDEALDAALSALRYLEENDLPLRVVAVLDTVASVYLAVGDLETAHEFAEKSYARAREQESWRGEGDALITLGRIALARQRYDEALDSTQRALGLAQEHARAVEEFKCHELLAQIHEQRGDAVTALAEYRRFHDLERARISQDSATRLAQLGVEHKLETARMDAEIHRLRSLALEREIEANRLTQAHLEAQASLDPLTELYNRRHLSVIADEMQAALERGDPVCLMLFDIDRFKRVNDTSGHAAGDRVLVSIARQLGKNCRASDVPCRYGGDEFLVLLVGMDARAGAEAAERLRVAIETMAVESDAEPIVVTISAGVVCVGAGGRANLPALIEQADRALYRAKRAGRNRAVIA
jgi:diguanylate cyclase (GGDEF)-like protein